MPTLTRKILALFLAATLIGNQSLVLGLNTQPLPLTAPWSVESGPLLNLKSYGTLSTDAADVSPATKTVFFIQDIHANAEAQNNNRRAIEWLVKNKKIETVALEGAFGPIDLSAFEWFTDRSSLIHAADYALSQKLISGPIHAALVSVPGIRVLGVDDAYGYRANVEALREAKQEQKSAIDSLESESKKRQKEKNRILNRKLRSLDHLISAYHHQKIPLGRYLTYLVRYSQDIPEPVSDFLRAFELEQSIRPAKVEKERTRLISLACERLSAVQAKQLEKMAFDFRSGQLNPVDFYSHLFALVPSRVGLTYFPTLVVYLDYLRLSERLDGKELLAAVARMEQQATDRLIRTPEERDLIERSRSNFLSKKLVSFEMTRSEWDDYKSYPTAEYATFENFYRWAELRDEAMAERILDLLRETPSLIFVGGGFHFDGVAARLKQAGVHVPSFVPKVTKAEKDDHVAYLNSFVARKSPLHQLFKAEKLFLAPLQTEGLIDVAAVGTGLVKTQNPALNETEFLQRVLPAESIEQVQIKGEGPGFLITIKMQTERLRLRIMRTASGVVIGVAQSSRKRIGYYIAKATGLFRRKPVALTTEFAAKPTQQALLTNTGFNGGDDNADYRFPQQLVDKLKERESSDPIVILDIGTARGDIPKWLAKQDPRFRVIGVDRDPRMVKEASATPSAIALPKTGSLQFIRNQPTAAAGFLQADLEVGLPFPDQSVDAVTVIRMRDGILDRGSRERMMQEIARVLKPGGIVHVLEDMEVKESDPDGAWYQQQYEVHRNVLQQLIVEDFDAFREKEKREAYGLFKYQTYIESTDFRLRISLRNKEGGKPHEMAFPNPERDLIRKIKSGDILIRGIGIHETQEHVISDFNDHGFSPAQDWWVQIPEKGDRTGHFMVFKGFLFEKTVHPLSLAPSALAPRPESETALSFFAKTRRVSRAVVWPLLQRQIIKRPTVNLHRHFSSSVSAAFVASLYRDDFVACREFARRIPSTVDPRNAAELTQMYKLFREARDSAHFHWVAFDPTRIILRSSPGKKMFQRFAKEIVLESARQGNHFMAIRSTFDGFWADRATAEAIIRQTIEGLQQAEYETGGRIAARLVLAVRKNLPADKIEQMINMWLEIRKDWKAQNRAEARYLWAVDSIGYEEDYDPAKNATIYTEAAKSGQIVFQHMGEWWYVGELLKALERIDDVVESNAVSILTNPIALFVDAVSLSDDHYTQQQKEQIRRLQNSLFEKIRRKHIVVEISPTSNDHMSIKSRQEESWRFRPLSDVLMRGVWVTVTDDDQLIFETSFLNELRALFIGDSVFGKISAQQLMQLVRNSVALKKRFADQNGLVSLNQQPPVFVFYGTGNSAKKKAFKEAFATQSPIVPLVVDDLKKKKAAGPVGLEETGGSYRDNALLKARRNRVWALQQTNEPFYTIADDGGVEIEDLGGVPGLYSHRYAMSEPGYRALYQKSPEEAAVAKLWDELKRIGSSGSRVRGPGCLAIITPDGTEVTIDIGGEEGVVPPSLLPVTASYSAFYSLIWNPFVNKSYPQFSEKERRLYPTYQQQIFDEVIRYFESENGVVKKAAPPSTKRKKTQLKKFSKPAIPKVLHKISTNGLFDELMLDVDNRSFIEKTNAAVIDRLNEISKDQDAYFGGEDIFIVEATLDFVGFGICRELTPNEVIKRVAEARRLVQAISRHSEVHADYFEFLKNYTVQLTDRNRNGPLFIAVANFLSGRWFNSRDILTQSSLYEGSDTIQKHPWFGSDHIATKLPVNLILPPPQRKKAFRVLLQGGAEKPGPNKKTELMIQTLRQLAPAGQKIELVVNDIQYQQNYYFYDAEKDRFEKRKTFQFDSHGKWIDPQSIIEYRRVDPSDVKTNAVSAPHLFDDSEKFDAIVSARVSIHYRNNQAKIQNLLANNQRLLAPRGILLFDTPEAERADVYYKDAQGDVRYSGSIPFRDSAKVESDLEKIFFSIGNESDLISRVYRYAYQKIGADRRRLMYKRILANLFSELMVDPHFLSAIFLIGIDHLPMGLFNHPDERRRVLNYALQLQGARIDVDQIVDNSHYSEAHNRLLRAKKGLDRFDRLPSNKQFIEDVKLFDGAGFNASIGRVDQRLAVRLLEPSGEARYLVLNDSNDFSARYDFRPGMSVIDSFVSFFNPGWKGSAASSTNYPNGKKTDEPKGYFQNVKDLPRNSAGEISFEFRDRVRRYLEAGHPVGLSSDKPYWNKTSEGKWEGLKAEFVRPLINDVANEPVGSLGWLSNLRLYSDGGGRIWDLRENVVRESALEPRVEAYSDPADEQTFEYPAGFYESLTAFVRDRIGEEKLRYPISFDEYAIEVQFREALQQTDGAELERWASDQSNVYFEKTSDRSVVYRAFQKGRAMDSFAKLLSLRHRGETIGADQIHTGPLPSVVRGGRSTPRTSPPVQQLAHPSDNSIIRANDTRYSFYLRGSKGTFLATPELQYLVHNPPEAIVAVSVGGGGDSLLGILGLMEIQQMYRQIRAEGHTDFREPKYYLQESPDKRGIENIDGTPRSVAKMRIHENGHIRKLTPLKGTKKFFLIEPGLRVNMPLRNEKAEPLSIEISIDWSPGQAAAELAEKYGIQIIIGDDEATPQELAADFLLAFPNKSVALMGFDNGGDVAKYFKNRRKKNAEHDGAYLFSPINDTYIATYLHSVKELAASAAVHTALIIANMGGDGESHVSGYEDVEELLGNGGAIGYWDLPAFLSKTDVRIAENAINQKIKSEFTRNFIRRVLAKAKSDDPSSFGPMINAPLADKWAYLLSPNPMLPRRPLGGGTRVEILARAAWGFLVFDPEKIYQQLELPIPRSMIPKRNSNGDKLTRVSARPYLPKSTWHQIGSYFEANGLDSELTEPLRYADSVKYSFLFLKQIFQGITSGEQSGLSWSLASGNVSSKISRYLSHSEPLYRLTAAYLLGAEQWNESKSKVWDIIKNNPSGYLVALALEVLAHIGKDQIFEQMEWLIRLQTSPFDGLIWLPIEKAKKTDIHLVKEAAKKAVAALHPSNPTKNSVEQTVLDAVAGSDILHNVQSIDGRVDWVIETSKPVPVPPRRDVIKDSKLIQSQA